jgi:hypothetical protein
MAEFPEVTRIFRHMRFCRLPAGKVLKPKPISFASGFGHENAPHIAPAWTIDRRVAAQQRRRSG